MQGYWLTIGAFWLCYLVSWFFFGDIADEIAGVNKDLEEFKKDLEEEYGAINIDMSTGEYTIIEKEDEGESAVVKAED